jgi:preprotein translocase subunit SecG
MKISVFFYFVIFCFFFTLTQTKNSKDKKNKDKQNKDEQKNNGWAIGHWKASICNNQKAAKVLLST